MYSEPDLGSEVATALEESAGANYEEPQLVEDNYEEPELHRGNYVEPSQSNYVEPSQNNYFEPSQSNYAEGGTRSSNYVEPAQNNYVEPTQQSRFVYADASDELLEYARPSTSSSSVAAPPAAVVAARNWTEEFVALLHSGDALQLQTLINEFQAEALPAAVTIVREKDHETFAKTIKPLAGAKGVAGGLKFLHRNIFFKFAVDFSALYGGDEFAGKAASQEILGLQRIFQCIRGGDGGGKIAELNVPIMCVMDVLGYRLIASSLLSLGPGSLVYGSDDGGVTVNKSNVVLNGLMERLGNALYLKPHIVGPGVELLFPADIEGHLANDRRFYVIDTARLWCPEPPLPVFLSLMLNVEGQVSELELPFRQRVEKIKEILGAANLLNHSFASGTFYHSNDGALPVNSVATRLLGMANVTIHGRAILVPHGIQGRRLYSLLRPEFIRTAGPLSSDTFTAFASSDPDRLVHEKQARDAFAVLTRERVISLAKNVDSGAVVLTSSSSISEALHRAGINVRFVGLLRSHVRKNLYARQVLAADMIARSFKSIARSSLRSSGTSSIAALLTVLVGSDDASKDFWNIGLRVHMTNKFGMYNANIFDEGTVNDMLRYRDQVPRALLFSCVLFHLQIRASHPTLTALTVQATAAAAAAAAAASPSIVIGVNQLTFASRIRSLQTFEETIASVSASQLSRTQSVDEIFVLVKRLFGADGVAFGKGLVIVASQLSPDMSLQLANALLGDSITAAREWVPSVEMTAALLAVRARALVAKGEKQEAKEAYLKALLKLQLLGFRLYVAPFALVLINSVAKLALELGESCVPLDALVAEFASLCDALRVRLWDSRLCLAVFGAEVPAAMLLHRDLLLRQKKPVQALFAQKPEVTFSDSLARVFSLESFVVHADHAFLDHRVNDATQPGALDTAASVPPGNCGCFVRDVASAHGRPISVGVGAQLRPEIVSGLGNVTQIAASSVGADQYMFIITGGGAAVFACGANSFGQLGLGDTTTRRTFELVAALPAQTVTKVACSGSFSQEHHVLALASTGAVYAWGCGNSFQLGNGRKVAMECFPRLIQSLDGHAAAVRDIAAGDGLSAALNDRGEILVWGTIVPKSVVEFPQVLKGDHARVVHFSVSAKWGCLCDIDGAAFVFGTVPTSVEQTPETSCATSHRVLGLASVRVVRVAAGLAHGIVRSDSGAAFAFGFNQLGQFGISDMGGTCPINVMLASRTKVVSQARRIAIGNVADVSASGNQTLLLLGDGRTVVHFGGEAGVIPKRFVVADSFVRSAVPYAASSVAYAVSLQMTAPAAPIVSSTAAVESPASNVTTISIQTSPPPCLGQPLKVAFTRSADLLAHACKVEVVGFPKLFIRVPAGKVSGAFHVPAVPPLLARYLKKGTNEFSTPSDPKSVPLEIAMTVEDGAGAGTQICRVVEQVFSYIEFAQFALITAEGIPIPDGFPVFYDDKIFIRFNLAPACVTPLDADVFMLHDADTDQPIGSSVINGIRIPRGATSGDLRVTWTPQKSQNRRVFVRLHQTTPSFCSSQRSVAVEFVCVADTHRRPRVKLVAAASPTAGAPPPQLVAAAPKTATRVIKKDLSDDAPDPNDTSVLSEEDFAAIVSRSQAGMRTKIVETAQTLIGQRRLTPAQLVVLITMQSVPSRKREAWNAFLPLVTDPDHESLNEVRESVMDPREKLERRKAEMAEKKAEMLARRGGGGK